MDRLVIYKAIGNLKVTPESNYNTRIQNARKIMDASNFDSPTEIIAYFIQYGWAQSESEFIVIE
jgi:hypothetical protein